MEKPKEGVAIFEEFSRFPFVSMVLREMGINNFTMETAGSEDEGALNQRMDELGVRQGIVYVGGNGLVGEVKVAAQSQKRMVAILEGTYPGDEARKQEMEKVGVRVIVGELNESVLNSSQRVYRQALDWLAN